MVSNCQLGDDIFDTWLVCCQLTSLGREQVVHTHVPLSSSSRPILWHWLQAIDALWWEEVTVGLAESNGSYHRICDW